MSEIPVMPDSKYLFWSLFWPVLGREMSNVLLVMAAGIRVPELCRKHGISSANSYKWHAPHERRGDRQQ